MENEETSSQELERLAVAVQKATLETLKIAKETAKLQQLNFKLDNLLKMNKINQNMAMTYEEKDVFNLVKEELINKLFPTSVPVWGVVPIERNGINGPCLGIVPYGGCND